MFKLAKPFFIKVITPLHAGSGQDLGIVDMPIQRERHTGFPKIEASGLKGSMREAFKESKEDIEVGTKVVNNENREETIFLTFGPDPKNGDSRAGSLGFTDAKILLFPVKSMKGVFAYITCPSVVERFKKDLIISGTELKIGTPSPNSIACQKKDSSLVIEKQNRVVLEEYSFEVVEDSSTAAFGKWVENILGDNIQKKLVVLSDEDFRDFVNLSTEVVTRTRINP
jgi:CRISPR-associated protein Cmr4